MTRIEISGPEHAKKTTLAVIVADYLESLGIEVVRQQADPQYAAKAAAGVESLREKVAGTKVFICEMQTSR